MSAPSLAAKFNRFWVHKIRADLGIASRALAVLLYVKLIQKGEEGVRKFLRQLILRSKLSADLRLNGEEPQSLLSGAETQSLLPIVPFVEFREVEPFQRHLAQQCAIV